MRNRLFTRLPFILGMLAGAMLAPILSELVGPVVGQSRDPAEGLDLAAVVSDLQERLDATEAKLAAVSVDEMSGAITIANADLYIDGGNVHVRDGSGTTDGTVNGKGNLIVGYNELREDLSDDRSGSHNLILGLQNSFSSYGGLVAGDYNTISGQSASVSGGSLNTASGDRSSVSGGTNNIASGAYSSISGGAANATSGVYSSISGGQLNRAGGTNSSVSGGNNRIIADGVGSETDWRAGSLHEDN